MDIRVSRSSGTSKCENLSTLASLEDHKTIVETSLRLLAGTWMSEGYARPEKSSKSRRSTPV
ncbi:hypothetical protein NQ318_006073 [Aromia moschata]|uniref:Uncharacterized protein n=1 Tax=Aromia moschata TaxID=1265417 RepID=A0AAV8Z2K3_9CUCU|nr:hypothetical protein NQ318_006073 [Aromia moschata]